MTQLIVLIPHYNNNDALLKSIQSIDEDIIVDVLVVDDGSTVQPNLEKLNSLYKNKGQVYLELLSNNRGIENALNKGLEICKHKGYNYIGRLDSGDLNKPNKYKKQLEHLESNPEIMLLGTWVDLVDEQGNYVYTLKHPSSDATIRKKMYFNSMFVHPSVVFRTAVIDTVGFYPTEYPYAEDYAYFFKIMNHFKVENLAESLLIYEINPNSISSLKRRQQVKNRIKIIYKNFYFGLYPLVGLLRNIPLLFVSRGFANTIKKMIST